MTELRPSGNSPQLRARGWELIGRPSIRCKENPDVIISDALFYYTRVLGRMHPRLAPNESAIFSGNVSQNAEVSSANLEPDFVSFTYV